MNGGMSSDRDTVVAVLEDECDESNGGGWIGVRLEIELRMLAVVELGPADTDDGSEHDDVNTDESHDVRELWVSEPGLAEVSSANGDMMMSA